MMGIPWSAGSPAWAIWPGLVVLAVGALLLVACGVTVIVSAQARVKGDGRQIRNEQLNRIRPQMGPGVGLLAVLVFIVGVVLAGVSGSEVTTAWLLGAHPGQVTSTRVEKARCSRCNPIVEYSIDGRSYAQEFGSDPGQSPTRVVYNRSDPDHAQLYDDWKSSNSWVALEQMVAGLLCVGISLVLIPGFLRWVQSQGRDLRPGVEIYSVQPAGRSKTAPLWVVGFSDNRRFRYADNAITRETIRNRVTPETWGRIEPWAQALLEAAPEPEG